MKIIGITRENKNLVKKLRNNEKNKKENIFKKEQRKQKIKL